MRAGQPGSSNRRTSGGGDKVFAAWFRDVARTAGYDVDETYGKGWKRQLADDSGVSESAVGRYTMGQSLPSPAMASALAPQLNVSVDDLLVKSGHKTPADVLDSGGSPGPACETPTARRLDIYLAARKLDDPERQRMERVIDDVLAFANRSGNAGR